jgi:hypothetical protein
MGLLGGQQPNEGDEVMDVGTAFYWDFALAGLCLLTLGVALAVRRSERRTIATIERRTHDETRTSANVRLLEFRADELAREVAELEQAREELLLTEAGILRGSELRAALGNGWRPKMIVRIPEPVGIPDEAGVAEEAGISEEAGIGEVLTFPDASAGS